MAVARCRAAASAGGPGESHPHAVDADYDALADNIRVRRLDVRSSLRCALTSGLMSWQR